MHTAIDVAKWFLQRNNIETVLEDAELISNLKLEKLLYYAQGVFLGITGNVLFNDDIVAWDHGPVVEVVYRKYKMHGSEGIPFSEIPTEKYCTKEESILEQVYDYFCQYSAWKLRNMTHGERPWKETEKNDVICTSLIKEFFEEEYIIDEEEDTQIQ